jgi:murein DD-endopeptidase MepM/ murein hydrolase activator NlpD
MVGYDVGYGNYVIIDHGSGWESQYAHCSTVYVTIGQSVSMGDKIALVGDTGEVTGPHLHFELKCDGVYYNPEFYLA